MLIKSYVGEFVKISGGQYEKENLVVIDDPFDGKQYAQNDHTYSARVVEFFLRKCSGMGNYDTRQRIVRGYWPNFDPERLNQVIIWPNHKAREKGKKGRTPIKIGRFVKKIFPELDDTQVEKIVDDFKEQFHPPKCKIFEGKSKEDFIDAYTGDRAPTKNLVTTYEKKSLADSCMRGEKSFPEGHPSQAYASGDFSIVYAKDEKDRIYGRSVVYHGPDGSFYAPCYVVCEQTYEMMMEYMKGKGYESAEYRSWEGARLLRIKADNGGFIGPYIDVEPRCLDDNGSYLVVSKYGSIDASDYQGILGGHEYTCEECGCGLHEDDTYHDESGNVYCESCHNNLFVWCSEDDTHILREDAVQAFVSFNSWGVAREWFHNNSGNIVYIDRLDEYYHVDLVIIDAHGDPFTTKEYDNRDWAQCEWTGEYYPIDEIKETTCGQFVNITSLKDDESWQLNDQGLWENIQLELGLEEETNAA